MWGVVTRTGWVDSSPWYDICADHHHCGCVVQELALRDDTLLVEDAAGALHVALNRAEVWCRASASKAGLLAEVAVALEALASYEASYTYGEAATTQALSATAQVKTLEGRQAQAKCILQRTGQSQPVYCARLL